MSRSIAEAAQGTGSIAGSMAAISGASEATGNDAGAARGAADELAGITQELTRLVDQFTV